VTYVGQRGKTAGGVSVVAFYACLYFAAPLTKYPWDLLDPRCRPCVP
jgi:hypothetical protein